jgi:hypothetical protein
MADLRKAYAACWKWATARAAALPVIKARTTFVPYILATFAQPRFSHQ